MSWHRERMCAFDLETTGVNPETARIVTAAIVLVGGEQTTQTMEWLTDVGGEEIPEGAAKVHGITTAKARAEGRPIADVVREITGVLVNHIIGDVPIVVMNARYDLTLFDRELERLGQPGLAELADHAPIVLDPLVLDRAADRYRPGKRTLTDLCEHYRIKLTDAHSAAADALAAARVLYRIAQITPNAQAWKTAELHEKQIQWAAEQAASLQDHFRSKGRADVVDGRWPLIPRQQGGAS